MSERVSSRRNGMVGLLVAMLVVVPCLLLARAGSVGATVPSSGPATTADPVTGGDDCGLFPLGSVVIDIVGHQGFATVTLAADPCHPILLRLISHSTTSSPQTEFDSDSITIDKAGTYTLGPVELPCNYQVDLRTGLRHQDGHLINAKRGTVPGCTTTTTGGGTTTTTGGGTTTTTGGGTTTTTDGGTTTTGPGSSTSRVVVGSTVIAPVVEGSTVVRGATSTTLGTSVLGEQLPRTGSDTSPLGWGLLFVLVGSFLVAGTRRIAPRPRSGSAT